MPTLNYTTTVHFPTHLAVWPYCSLIHWKIFTKHIIQHCYNCIHSQ